MLQGIFRDISKRRQIENALRESEARWQYALEGAGDGVWDWDVQTSTVFYSRQWKFLLGYKEHEVGTGLCDWKDRLHPADSARVLDALHHYINGQAIAYNCEYRLLTGDGTYKWVLDRGKVVERSADGTPVRVIGTIADISTRKQMEFALQQSEERFRSLVSSMEDVVYTLDKEQRHTGVYGQWLEKSGVSPEYFLGKKARDLFSDEAAAAHEIANQRALAGEAVVYDWSFSNPQEEIYFQTSVSPLRDSSGEIIGIVGLGRNITESKRLERRLSEILARAQATLKALPDLMFEVDDSGYIYECHTPDESVFSFSLSTLQGSSLLSILPPEAAGVLQTVFEQARRRVTSAGGILTFPMRQGTVWFKVSAAALGDPQSPDCHFILLAHDITELKRIEHELRDSEARFRALFEQAHDAVFMLDLQGHHFANNSRASEMLGYTSEEFSQIAVFDLSAGPDETRDWIDRLCQGQPVPLYERQIRKKNGELIPVEVNIELVSDKDGKPLHIQSVMRDISERKRMENALRESNHELSSKIEEIDSLHDELRAQALRDPLTGLYNRRYLSDFLARDIVRVKREKNSVSVLMIDIDHFKDVNDAFGHQVGDLVLIKIANLFLLHVRESDIACRYGGEEFVLVLANTTSEVAFRRAETIRQLLAAHPVVVDSNQISLTISIGVATFPEHGENPNELIVRADLASYQSKRAGRNRTTIWSDPSFSIPNTGPVRIDIAPTTEYTDD